MCIGHEGPTRNDQCEYGIKGRAPELGPGDSLIYDECGRCSPQVNGKGSTDYHSHHFRVVRSEYGPARLLVKHGGGQEEIALGYDHTRIIELLAPLDSDARYLMLHNIYSVAHDAADRARKTEESKWIAAAREKRIKVRKMPGREAFTVRIMPVKN